MKSTDMDPREYIEYLDPKEAAREARRDREHPAEVRPAGRHNNGRGSSDGQDWGRRPDDRGRRHHDRVR